jgi:hypothetical protein
VPALAPWDDVEADEVLGAAGTLEEIIIPDGNLMQPAGTE